MSYFIFSCDGHITEPKDLFEDVLPTSLKDKAMRVEVRGEHRYLLSGDQVLNRSRIVQNADLGRSHLLGTREIAGRKLDMAQDGIDAELIFPQQGMWAFGIADPDVELAHAQAYNDWASDFFRNDRDIFVAAAILPVRNLEQTLQEMKRAAALGFKVQMLPSTTPPGVAPYNSDKWDPVFSLATELDVVFTLHTGTGIEGGTTIERGPGGAIINYSHQIVDAQRSAMYLVAGGVLDRFPKSRIAFIECGASWLGALSERMDEVHEAHSAYVRPVLSRKPSEIIRDQVKASFQRDRECIMGRSVTGHRAIMWAADYPHMEGTFPRSQEIINELFAGIDITEDEKADILGRTAADFFGLYQHREQAKAAALN